VVFCVLLHVGYMQVSKAANTSGWHDAHVPPPEFPRYMGCGGCDAGMKDNAAIAKCAHPCYGLDLVLKWEAFAKSHDYKLVYFPSRPGPRGEPPVNISAWWLPADGSRLPPGKIPPRIVALHGLASNNNHCGVQSACYLLRTLGFSCITPSVRDYGLSGPSTHPGIMTWGYDYADDILGAWDYAVKDPDGLLGGPLPPDQVGIMGFSKGAYATAIAFNLEKRIPGAWIDSAPYSGLYGMIDAIIRPFLGVLTPLARQPVWWGATWFSPVPVDYYKPTEMFANCSAPRRRVFIAHSNSDDTVPVEESAAAIFEIGSRVDCYDLWLFTPDESCDGAHHHVEMWQYPETTRARLCYFWSKVFYNDHNYSSCGLDELPKLGEEHTLRLL